MSNQPTVSLGESSKLPPREPGQFIFVGARKIRDAIYEHIAEPITVDTYKRHNGTTELVARMAGRSSVFRLANFNGTWIRLQIGE